MRGHTQDAERIRGAGDPRQSASCRRGKVLGAAIGDCVHVAGIYSFLRLAAEQGYETVFLGPAVPLETLMTAIRREAPDIVGIGYRLSPEAAGRLLGSLKGMLQAGEPACVSGPRFVFGGTPPVARVASEIGIFDRVFDGSEGDDATVRYLTGRGAIEGAGSYPQTLVERIRSMEPYPLIRHHFGLPSLEETVEGARRLAEAKALDVMSIGPDQNAQESFFRPWEMDPRQDGAGGVAVRTPEDFKAIFEASRTGNYPLLRSYSGTRDQIRMAEMLVSTINLAWGAIPLMWYNVLDGRSSRPLAQSIAEAQAAMAWHAQRAIPVEVNEAHQWSLRDSSDGVAVAMAFLAAYNAKRAGVRDYVAQFMFNTPPATSPAMDLAKMLAKLELISSLEDEGFRVWRETRTGLLSYPTDMDVAKGQLASSVLLQIALRPHIVHVVAHTEADHAARPEDIEEAVKIARGAIRAGLAGLPDAARDAQVARRKEELASDARAILGAVREIADSESGEDPWASPAALCRAVEIGILDAPHLKGNPVARGCVETRIVDGACYAWDPVAGRALSEAERIERLMDAAARRACPASLTRQSGRGVPMADSVA